MNSCVYTFRTGKRKDQQCGKPTANSFCDKHQQMLAQYTVQSLPGRTKIQQSSSDTLESFRAKLNELDIAPDNRAVIEKRLQYLSTLSKSSTEYHKNIAWLKHALNFPYNKSVEVPVSCETESITIDETTVAPQRITVGKDVANYINTVYDRLDDYIYGMKNVKEEILSFVCKRISNPDSSDHVLALQGSNGVGKCFALGTEILMFDGTTKVVEEVKIGDILMGDDNKPRTVLSLGRGEDQLYRIVHKSTGDSYTVNSDHILVLRPKRQGTVVDEGDNLVLKFTDSNTGKQRKVGVRCNGDRQVGMEQFNKSVSKEFLLRKAMGFIRGVESVPVQLTVKEYLKLPLHHRNNLVGYSMAVEYPQVDVSVDPYLAGLWYHMTALEGERSDTEGCCLYMNAVKTTLLSNNFNLEDEAFDVNDIPREYLVNVSTIRQQFLQGVFGLPREQPHDSNELKTVKLKSARVARQVKNLCNSVGWHCLCMPEFKDIVVGYDQVPEVEYKLTLTKIETAPSETLCSEVEVESVGWGRYYGFAIDGNERFLLGNCVVTHNTRLARGLSKALGVPFRTINLGSVSDVSYFTGHGFTYVESEPGRIVQILNETQCKNCIIYFDELDKIHRTEKGQAINGFLTHLIDPSQNKAFQDVYLAGLDLDVSQVFFVFSFNDETLIDATVRDRLKIIHIDDPTIDDKINIAEKFIIPEICQNVNFNVTLDRSIVKRIISSHDDTQGLRAIKRTLENIISKLNVVRMLDTENRKKLSYYKDRYMDIILNIIEENCSSISKFSSYAMYS